ncbi:hypothetical protein P7C73_g5205, partial [Tremellales sp. Uapishka_1]
MPDESYGTVSSSSSSSETLDAPDTQPTGKASLSSSVTNLANTIIGSGALAFPSAFASMGLAVGFLSCAFSGVTAFFGLYLLSRCATRVGERPGDEGRKASFNEVARLTFGKGWATRGFDLAIAIKCFGVSVSYLIIVKTLLPQVCLTLSTSLGHALPDHSILLSDRFWLVAAMLVIIPLSFLRTLDSLRFTSQIALATVVYLVLVVVGWYFVKGESSKKGNVVWARFGHNTLSSFPVQVFAYTCAQNLFPIFNELKDRSQKRMNIVMASSIGSAAAVYEVLGIIGYLTFGDKVGSNVIAMYPATSLVIAVGRLGMVLLVGLSYPLQALPCRQSLHGLTAGLFTRTRETKAISSDGEAEEDEESSLVPKHGDIGRRSAGDMSQGEYIGFTVGILVSGFIIAELVDEMGVVLGFVGSTGSTIISFILPGFFYFRLFRSEPGATKWFALALGIYGLAVMGFCLTFNILNLRPRREASPSPLV